MFALEKELIGLIDKDPSATDAQKERARRAVACLSSADCVRFADAAERLGVCKAVVYNLVKKGELAGVRLSGSRPIGVTEASIREFLRTHMTAARG